MEERHSVVEQINKKVGEPLFKALDQLPTLNRLCDVFVDATRRRLNSKNAFDAKYPSFRGTVLLQSGEYPRGRLISPPLIEPENKCTQLEPHIYRQGDCILSGTVPVLAALASVTEEMRLSITMQIRQQSSLISLTRTSR